MTHESDNTASISEQAAHWWEVFHDGDASAAEHREFADWVARSPERVAAYLEVARLRKALKSPAIQWPATSAEELIRAARAAPPEPLAFVRRADGAETRTRTPAPRLRYAFALAATLVIAIGAAWMYSSRPQQYLTAFGEQRSITLEDGSRITLNTASKIEVVLRKDHRLVRLLEGEALFEVAHDASRPFDVSSGNAVVRAVGTQFNVDVRNAQSVVTVVEGRVAFVSGQSPVLTAGDRLTVDAAGKPTLEHGTSLDTAIAWTRHQLIFEHRPLGEIAAEFNRYNRARISIDSESLGAQEVTGVFQSNDPASFVAFLSSSPGVVVTHDGTGGYRVTEAGK
jgi:transmembrane sensor